MGGVLLGIGVSLAALWIVIWLRAWVAQEREALQSGRKRIYDVWPRGVPLPPPCLFHRYGYDEEGYWIGG